jgi:uncharacterized protein (TIGR04255 family)
MVTSFVKAPLVELIAELRWTPIMASGEPIPQGPEPGNPAQPVFLLTDTKFEEFFMRLGGELFQAGFQRSERLVPPGFPTVPYQPIVRYRSDTVPTKSVLYQVGSGVFSIHGVPPYRSWKEFSPSVRAGIEALLKTREAAEHRPAFTQISLRYIDFFGEELMRGRGVKAFFTDVLGISPGLPGALTNVATSDEMSGLFLKFVLPLAIGNLIVSVGDGKVNNLNGIVLDTTVSSTGVVPPDVDAILAIFNSAHTITNTTFMDLTSSIHDLMEPQATEN